VYECLYVCLCLYECGCVYESMCVCVHMCERVYVCYRGANTSKAKFVHEYDQIIQEKMYLRN
jgi:hypothetical protein